MTLAEFLLARIAEDEADAKLARGHRYITGQKEERSGIWVHDGSISYEDDPFEDVVEWVYDEGWAHIARHDPARVLAECEAKRRIVDTAERMVADADDHDADMSTKERWFAGTCARSILRALARPYKGHPDYKPGWLI
jgi:hypothetical protein